VLEDARVRLLTPQGRLAPVFRARLACAYVGALGQGPQEAAVAGMEELLDKMEKIPDTFTTRTHYSKLHLMVIEAMELALDQVGG